MKRRMKLLNIFWFCVIGWVLLLIIYFPKKSEFGTIHAPPPIRSEISWNSILVTPTSQWHPNVQFNRSRPDHLPEETGNRKDDADQQKINTKPLQKSAANYTKRPARTLPEDWLEYYSNGRDVVRALWRGNVSSRMLSLRLQRAFQKYVDKNSYRVSYRSPQNKQLDQKQLEKQALLCQLKQHARVRVLDGTEEPFASLGWKHLVPSDHLDKLPGTPFRTCAVVSSAGSILNSLLGKEIDSHDAVLRFNAAPTQGFHKDVGKKTTIRIINSQVLANSEHRFNRSSLYKNITLVGWDPAPYSADLEKWYREPDFDLFTGYEDRRRRSPSQPFYILHPAFIWSLWTMLQTNTEENIQPNPPSTGYIGIAVMMNLCESVDVYEFIPSKRHTTRCHYYEALRDMACTLGAYHPLLYEKLLVRRMSTASIAELSEKGKVTLPGFSKISCPP
ncbi:beta-galactoside alpha-2,6-sialyltransferase 2-like [Astyanax mexicanus]|uniref:Beta-galactoside alpha-2,6-sialyltransferase 2 n=1 Tax=Astyanax mexicanus TaxID=7994 RepID=A0A8T2M005_ASTMX|nr:beta-galactoside alpha-2,6-sialyltransferase 2-like [Astyanax mexicanus]